MRASAATLSARVALVALGALSAAVFGWWHADRTRAWETPEWEPRGFVRLDAGADGGAETQTRTEPPGAFEFRDHPSWVVPVNLGCPRCVSGLARAFEARNRRRSPLRLVALVVDATTRPDADAIAPLRADARYWDRDGVWRKRWGHRVYGEAMLFTVGGRYVRTIAPGSGIEDALPTANLGVPPDDL